MLIHCFWNQFFWTWVHQQWLSCRAEIWFPHDHVASFAACSWCTSGGRSTLQHMGLHEFWDIQTYPEKGIGRPKKKSVKESNENLGKIVWALFSHLDSIYSMNWSWMINIFFTTKLTLPMWSLVALWAWVPRITARWIILGLVATARKVWFLTEQPRSSLMPFYAYVRYMALIIRPLRWGLAYLSGA